MPFEIALIYPFEVLLSRILSVLLTAYSVSLPNVLDMGRKRRKVHVGRKKEGQEPKIMDADRISKLPDHVIHHILSFLPTIDAVWTSLLSRRWRRMWYYVPTLKFSQFPPKDVESFYNFVDDCLKHRMMGMHHDTKSVITSFELNTVYRGRHSKVKLDRWLSFIAQPHLQKLVLNIGSVRRRHYCLPEVVLNLASLTVLELVFVELEACYPVSLPSLEYLHLGHVQMEDEILHTLLLGCPSLEELYIWDCDKLKSPRVSSSCLEFLDLSGNWETFTIKVEAINLQSFAFSNTAWKKPCSCRFDLASCKKIENLSLRGVSFYPDEDFASFISGLPLLESLALRQCDLIDIRNQHLKFLDVQTVRYKDRDQENWDEEDWDKVDWDKVDWDRFEISIDAPNLDSFKCYTKNLLVRFLMNSPNLSETFIHVGYCAETETRRRERDREWYINLIDFLSHFDCSKSIDLTFCCEEVFIEAQSRLRYFCISK